MNVSKTRIGVPRRQVHVIHLFASCLLFASVYVGTFTDSFAQEVPGHELWGPLYPSASALEGAVYDSLHDRLVVIGASESIDVWTLSLIGAPVWTQLKPEGDPPALSTGRAAVYDSKRNRVVLWTGRSSGSGNGGAWALSLTDPPRWTELNPSGTPPVRMSSFSAIYDPVRDRVIVFGGEIEGPSTLREVWSLSLDGSPSWSELTPAGMAPLDRRGHTAIYDSKRDRMVIYGGFSRRRPSVRLDDVWALSLASTTEWTELTPIGTKTARQFHAAVYDPMRDVMTVCGGGRADAVELSFQDTLTWRTIVPSGPGPLSSMSSCGVLDPLRSRMLIVRTERNDVEALSLSDTPTWSVLAANPGTPPIESYGHSATMDPIGHRMVMFGGQNGSGLLNGTWQLTLTGTPAWGALNFSPPPAARVLHTAIHDPVRNRVVLFGGYGTTYWNDAWTLGLSSELPRWSALAAAGTRPSARLGHGAVYDPVDDRMIVVGGIDPLQSEYRNDVWTLSLGGTPEWIEATGMGTPPRGRALFSTIYDFARRRIVIFGGLTSDGPPRNDVWELGLGATLEWNELVSTGHRPPARFGHAAVFDSKHDRMLVFGGQDSTGSYRNDVWALALSGPAEWTRLEPGGSVPGARLYATAVYDSTFDRTILFGGWDGAARSEAVALRWEATPPAPEPEPELPSRFELAPARPNPSRASVTFDFAVARTSVVTLTLYDLAGRVVRQFVEGPLSPGRHAVVWNGGDNDSHQVPNGIYFARMNSEGVEIRSRVVLLR